MIEYPLLESLKKHNDRFFANQILSLDNNSDYGNLVVVWHEIVIRVDCVNDQIIKLYDEFYKSWENVEKYGFYEMNLNQGYINTMLTEQIIYWLRKTTDEIISIIFILSYFKVNNFYPKKIKISSIAEFLNSNSPYYSPIMKYKSFLEILNEISNCYKHSFINSQIRSHRKLEQPFVFGYNLHFNDFKNEPKIISFNFSDFLNDYDKFLKDVKEFIELEFEKK